MQSTTVRCFQYFPLNLFLVFSVYISILVPEIDSYSKVSKASLINARNNSTYENVSQHKINHTLNLIFPEKFNGSSTTPTTTITDNFSGRANLKKTRIFPFTFVNAMDEKKQISNSSFMSESQIIRKFDELYPVYRPSVIPSGQKLNKFRGKGEAMDRYTPGEAVATSKFKNKPSYYYNRPQKQSLPLQSHIESISYPYETPLSTTQHGLFAFPPNLDSNYPPSSPDENNSKNQKQIISSYLPPPAGPVDNLENGYIGPINPEYLPSHLKNSAMNTDNSRTLEKMKNIESEKMHPSTEDQNNMNYDHEDYHDAPPSNVDADELHEMPFQPPTGVEDMMPMSTSIKEKPKINPNDLKDDNHDHTEEHDPREHDHDLKQIHPSSFHGNHGIDSYPEIILDHHPSFDHFHDYHYHLPPPTTTTEHPEQPRVKKYSYFYLGRKLWYIPLYFTIWFSFYILFLIIKSIARHKVDLPNHYKQRRAIIEAKQNFIDSEQIDRLTAIVMTSIEDFKKKYF